MFHVHGNSIQLTRGDSATLTVNLTNADGTPYELVAGDVLEFTAKKDASDPEAAISLTASDGTFTFAPSDTDGLEFGAYRYDIQLTHGSEVYTPIVSTFTLTEEVTWSASEGA